MMSGRLAVAVLGWWVFVLGAYGGETSTGGAKTEGGRQWAQFRGVGGNGVYVGGDAPAAWDGKSGKGVLWKAPVALPGYCSPVVWEGRVFVAGANEQKREVYCFSVEAGKLLWQSEVKDVPGGGGKPARVWREANYAAPTVATDGRRVYAVFANGDVGCFDLEGARLWAVSVGISDNAYGHASSPVICGELVIIQFDQGQAQGGQSRLLALDGRSGQTAWSVKRPVGASWATPLVIRGGGREQIVACGVPWIISYEVATGQELWRADCMEGGYWAAPSPVYGKGVIYAVTEGAVLAAVRVDGSGDVSKTHVAWRALDDLPSVCSPVSNGELVFIVASSGLLTCHDAKDGKKLWQRDYSGEDRLFESSPVIAGDRVYFMDSQGVMYIVRAAREFGEVGRCELGEGCPGASPAFVDGRMYIRGEKHIYCVGEVAAKT